MDSSTHSSPFLPGTQIQYAWDSTSLGWFKECPRKYYYSMIAGYRPKGDRLHLDFGSWYHSGLEHFDRLRAEGIEYEEALRQTVRHVMEISNGWQSNDSNKNRETLVRSVVWYIEHFKDDPAKTVILENGKPAVELSFKMELGWGPGPTTGSYTPYILCGHLDRVVNFLDGTYVMDRKTSSHTISTSYFDQYDPDNQMSLYTLAAKVIYKTPVKGVIIDAVQIAVGFSRFSRGFTNRTDSQLEEWLDDLKSWFELAEFYAGRNYWPMNDKSCHKYGGCHFRKVCGKSPEVRKTFLESDFLVSPWNPLVPR